MRKARKMERRTGEPSMLPTHRTFKTSNTVHFHSSRTGELRKKHSCTHTLPHSDIYTLPHIHSHVLMLEVRTLWVSLWTNTIMLLAFNPAWKGFKAHEIHSHYCPSLDGLIHALESHTDTLSHTHDQAENQHLSNVSVSITKTIVCCRTESETDKNQQHTSDSYKQWNKTGHGKDTAVERRGKKSNEGKVLRQVGWKKVATLRQTQTPTTHKSQQSRESGHVSDTSSFLHTYTLFNPNNSFWPLKYFFVSLSPIIFPWKPVTDVTNEQSIS